MPNPNIFFQGQQLILPGAYYADDVSALLPTNPPPTPPLVFIGNGYGVKPQTPTSFATPQDLMAALRGGPASGFVQFIYSPSPQVNGAQLVTFINAAANTQSSKSLSAGVTGILTLYSADYGAPSNLLQIGVSTGSNTGKKITLYDGFSNRQLVGDNLGVAFQLAYTGTATGGLSVTVSASGLNASGLTLTSPTTGESFTVGIGVGGYATLGDIINYINGTGFWSAIGIGDGTMPAQYLDVVTAGALTAPGTGSYVYRDVTCALGGPYWWLQQYATSMVSGVTVSGAVTQFVSGLAPTNIPLTPFTGATSVPPTNSDYATAFNKALTEPAWAVFADNNSAAIRALGTQHAVTASQPSYGKWRRFFTGSSVGDSVSGAISAALSMDAIQGTYVYPGIYRTDPISGVLTLYGGHYGAAAAAGIACGNIPALPMTNKALFGTGVETKLSLSQINQLQQSGVMLLTVPDLTRVPTILSDMTTWNIDSNPGNMFNQQVSCRFYTAYSLVNAMQPYTGTIAATVTMLQIRNAITAALNALIYTQGGNGVLNSWDPDSLRLTYTGQNQTLAIEVSVVLVGQNRFITIFVPIQPLNITVTSNSISA